MTLLQHPGNPYDDSVVYRVGFRWAAQVGGVAYIVRPDSSATICGKPVPWGGRPIEDDDSACRSCVAVADAR